MASPTEPTRVTIGDRIYQLRPWSYDDGERWSLELIRVAFGGVGARGEDDRALAAKLVGSVSPETFAEFRKTCCKYTDLIVVDDDSTERVVQLNAAVHLRGRYGDTLELVAAHVRREYGDFFGELGDLLARIFGGLGKAS